MNSDEEFDDLPSIIVNKSDSGKFVMPDADVLASQRILEATQECEIKRVRAEIASVTGGEESSSDCEMATCIDTLRMDVPPPIPHESPGLPPPSLTFLQSLLSTTQYNVLEDFINCLNNSNITNLEPIIADVLGAIECTMFREEYWQVEDMVCVGVTLSLVCITRVCRAVSQHLPTARRLLYYLIDKIYITSQLNVLGTILLRIYVDPHDRLELATVLEGGDGCNSNLLTIGIVRMSIHDLLRTNPDNIPDWTVAPYTAIELLALTTGKWKKLGPKLQLIVAQFLSRALAQIDDEPKTSFSILQDSEEEVGEECLARSELLLFLSASLSHGHSDHSAAEKLKLQVLVSKMQLHHRSSHTTLNGHRYNIHTKEDKDLEVPVEIGN